ncbi:alginate lyase family protein [Paenibacillus doosanensis]|uniref:alginate lyase family protein n=1 Tax=Paenibacillus doosanensis TaxID=1229154 RepID=UPI00217F9DDB|nr:alginate lyase family protein [Paenibacillus doosanensis]MCS7458805.1 alginate lyase family protein [Paenibacillus doosanensis]
MMRTTEDYNGRGEERFAFIDRGRLLRQAEASLHADTVHITDDVAPMSEGGIHDFYSNGDYWWPNPETADGLPYIRRDGESNPNNFDRHRLGLRRMRTHTANLAAAYKLTGEEKYAEKAVRFLKEFFLDEATRMNPHLLYAQAIPGICAGRGIGIIDTLHLIDIPFAVEALKPSSAMSEEIVQGLRSWFAAYLDWMSTHPNGIEEMNTDNNHSVCWFVQAAAFAWFTGNENMLQFCRQRYKEVLLPGQMAADGSFPREMERTKPYGYAIFVLDNMVTLCHILSTPEDDLWSFELPDGRSIRRGLDFLFPYLNDKSSWPLPPDVEHFDGWPAQVSSLLFAGLAFGEEAYVRLWQRLEPEPSDTESRRNIAIRQPLLWV